MRQTAIVLAAIAIAGCKSQSSSPDALDDGQLCQQTFRVLAMIPCPSAAPFLPACEQALRERCAPELRRVLICEISNGAAGHFCDTENPASIQVAIRPGYCVAEQQALHMGCLFAGTNRDAAGTN